MLTKDIMTVKVEGNQIVKIDADILRDIHHPIMITRRNIIKYSDKIDLLRAVSPCARDLRGTCDTLACMRTRRSRDLRVTCEY